MRQPGARRIVTGSFSHARSRTGVPGVMIAA